MITKMIHFDEIKNKALDLLTTFKIKNIDSTINYFVIRDVYGRISVFIESPGIRSETIIEVRNTLEENIGVSWINKVEEVSKNSSIATQLLETTNKVSNNIHFGERHLTRLNWFREKSNKNKLQKAKVVTFYSFKGGLGRTTSLVMSALQLARKGRTIVLVDFDLEAPGLSTLLPPENNETPNYGLIDYLIESNIYLKSSIEIDINDYIYSFRDKQLIGNNGGQVYILPASKLTIEKSDDYLEKMGRVDFGTPNYQNINNPISQMLQQVTDRFKPDFILLDARTGINDVGGLTLTNFTDLACLLFYGNEQNIAGMKIVLPKVIDAEVPFLLINSPVPITEEESKEELEFYLENSYNVLLESEYYSDYIPDLYDESADHYPINISYDSSAVLINSNNKLKRLLDNSGSSNGYYDIAEQISSFFGEELGLKILENYSNRSSILRELSEIMTGTLAASENEFNTSEELINKFFPLREHRFIFDPEKFLILGPKGSGKTALFSVLEHRNYAEKLASYLGLTTESTQKTHWVTGLKGLKQSIEFPSSANFESLGSEDDVDVFRRYWRILAIRSIHKQVDIEIPSIFSDISEVLTVPNSKLRELSKDLLLSEKLEDYLNALDTTLGQNDKKVSIIYDGLDVLLKNKNYRGKMISALISLWYEYISRYQNIGVKIFLREDIFRNEVKDIADKVKLGNYSERLSWSYDSLLSMVYKRMIQQSDSLAKLFEETLRPLGITVPYDERVGYVPRVDTEINKAILKILIGERMGTGKAAFTYNWIRNHLADTNEQIVPRSILTLFASAARKEAEQIELFPSRILIKSRNLQNVMAEVSKDRVTDLLEEYDEYEKIFTSLREYVPNFPASESEFKSALRSCGVPQNREQSTIDDLVSIGAMKPYQRKKNDPIRYHIPDIFLIGLGLTRRGLRAQK